MVKSEAHLDDRGPGVRTRFAGYTGDICGVLYVDGVAQSGMPEAKAKMCVGNFGATFEVLGPWHARVVKTRQRVKALP